MRRAVDFPPGQRLGSPHRWPVAAALTCDFRALARTTQGYCAELAGSETIMPNMAAWNQPDLCDMTTPAIVDRDPIVAAIGCEGTAPVLKRGPPPRSVRPERPATEPK